MAAAELGNGGIANAQDRQDVALTTQTWIAKSGARREYSVYPYESPPTQEFLVSTFGRAVS